MRTSSNLRVVMHFAITLLTILCIGCAGIGTKETPDKHRIYPHLSGTVQLVNGDTVEIVNSVVSITPDIIRIESTMMRTTILIQNVKTITLYNVDHHKMQK